MNFNPEKCSLPDISMEPFIDPQEIWDHLNNSHPTLDDVKKVIARSLDKHRLSLAETAILIKADDPESIEMIKAGARELKRRVYGNRIVLFAPLYVGNYCTNNCKYCGFKASNRDAVRKTLNKEELMTNVEALEAHGHKRLILVYGEHRQYSPEFIADCVRTVYEVKKGPGEIRRVNINAAPLEIEGFRTVKEAGIGTYQIFQETYHPKSYAYYHPSGRKADYNYRLTSLDRAMEAGIDDLGLGVLFGLYDWRFEVMSLIRHTNHLETCYGVGPHTLSFPRLQSALGIETDRRYAVSDEEFVRIIAILRLSVPYTGMILTAREPAAVRDEVLEFGCSQIDAGTKIELGAYAEDPKMLQNIHKEQFLINDNRSLDEVISGLLKDNYLPSFCTACYRKGRTGQHFMEFSVPGFIKNYCTPNALFTLAEYLEDYASETTRESGWQVINNNLHELESLPTYKETSSRLERIRAGERDLHF